MLGQTISDPDGIEGSIPQLPGLGLLNISTVMTAEKTTKQVEFEFEGKMCKGYEIHQGRTEVCTIDNVQCTISSAPQHPTTNTQHLSPNHLSPKEATASAPTFTDFLIILRLLSLFSRARQKRQSSLSRTRHTRSSRIGNTTFLQSMLGSMWIWRNYTKL